MKKGVFFLIFSVAIKLFAQTNLDEVVYLKNGSKIRGIIIEQIPNDKLKIQTNDDSVFVYTFAEIEKITKEPKIVTPNISKNATTTTKTGLSKDIIRHRNKGIAFTVTGTTLFAIGMPFFLKSRYIYGGIALGRMIPGAILVATGLPLMIVGPVQLCKYSKLKKEARGVTLSPSIGIHQQTGFLMPNGAKGISFGAAVRYTF